MIVEDRTLMIYKIRCSITPVPPSHSQLKQYHLMMKAPAVLEAYHRWKAAHVRGITTWPGHW